MALFADTLYYPEGGGHRWVYLNWALGLQALGCRVIWVEATAPHSPADAVRDAVTRLKHTLGPYGLADDIALCSMTAQPLERDLVGASLDLEAAWEADLLLNFYYGADPAVVRGFPRTALVDIDPGLLQTWVAEGQLQLSPHDVYFTTGETVAQENTAIPDCGLQWLYSPPAIFTPEWPVTPSDPSAPYTSITHWRGEWLQVNGEPVVNDKRLTFLEYADLPARVHAPLELAVRFGPRDTQDRATMEEGGWILRDSRLEARTLGEYRSYIQASRGEFSCAKPWYVRLRSAWVSDRTLCYLSSGKPAVVQHTGPSRFLPDSAGLFRFKNREEVVRAFEILAVDYDVHARLARALAEDYFDAKTVVARVLERALGQSSRRSRSTRGAQERTMR